MKTNAHLIPQMRKDGWSWDEIVKYFQLLDDWAGMNKAIKSRNLEAKPL